MGHRFLAAMLALLASLAAQIAPVHARVADSGRAEIGAIAAIAPGKSQVAGIAVRACLPSRRDVLSANATALHSHVHVHAATVEIGVDRAHE